MNRNPISTVNDWLEELGRQTPDGRWQLGPLGHCTLAFDENEVVIEVILPENRVAITVELLQSPDQLDRDVLIKLMEANFLGKDTGGATISLNPENGALCVGVTVPVDAFNQARFEAVLLGVVDQARDWKAKLTEWQENTVRFPSPIQQFV